MIKPTIYETVYENLWPRPFSISNFFSLIISSASAIAVLERVWKKIFNKIK
jgi:hypothetical protein